MAAHREQKTGITLEMLDAWEQADEMEWRYRFPMDLDEWMESLKGKGTLKSPYRCEVLGTIEGQDAFDYGWNDLANVFFKNARGEIYQYLNKPSWKMDAPGTIEVRMLTHHGERRQLPVIYEDTRMWDSRFIPLGYRDFTEKKNGAEEHRLVTNAQYEELRRKREKAYDPSDLNHSPPAIYRPAGKPLADAAVKHSGQPPSRRKMTVIDWLKVLILGGPIIWMYVWFPIGWTVYCLINYGIFAWATWLWVAWYGAIWIFGELLHR